MTEEAGEVLEKLGKLGKLDAGNLRDRLLAAREQNVDPLDFAHLPAVVSKSRGEEPVASVCAEEPRVSSVLEQAEFASFGAELAVSEAESLTEEETEYVVKVRKHVFARHVVLEFHVTNTIEGQVMTDVTVQLALQQGDASQWGSVLSLPAAVIPWDRTASCFVALQFDASQGVPEAQFGATVRFIAKDVEADELDQVESIEGFQEEYPVQDLVLSFPDFVARPALRDFRAAWSQGAESEAVEKVTLPFEEVETAVRNIVEVLGLSPMEGSERVPVGVGVGREV